MGSNRQAFFGLFNRLAIAKSELELRSRFMDASGELFGAKAWGFTLFGNDHEIAGFDLQGLPDDFVDSYGEMGIQADPIMSFVINRHIPAHNLSVLTPKDWKQSAPYQHLGLRYSFEHAMVGPLIGDGQMIGKIYFVRGADTFPFWDEDLKNLSALSMHLSVRLATLRSQVPELESEWMSRLTERELLIADLVAQGLSNTEIGKKLGISHNGAKQALKRMFRKLDVSARAEMVAKLRSRSVA